MDLASRRIVGWSMSDRIKAKLVCQALQSAYGGRKPSAGLIMHSDRGSQYASDRHRQLIKDCGMIQCKRHLPAVLTAGQMSELVPSIG